MINTSNEYKQKIRQNRIFEPIATITLADATVLNLVKSDFMENGITISDGVSESGKFTIGSAIINSLTLVLNNFSGKFDLYDFDGAVIRPSIGLKLSTTTEYIPKGVFTVDEATTSGSTIIITAYDNMIKFDRLLSEAALPYPITALAMLQAICTHCGVSLLTTDFLNHDFSITRAIEDTATTCREVLIYIAQIAGCFARCNTDGYLELKWFDMSVIDNEFISAGTFTDPSTDEISAGTFTIPSTDIIEAGDFTDLAKFHTFYSLGSMNVATEDIIITGIQVSEMGTDTDYGQTVLFGSAGYVLSIEDNPLIIEGKGSIIANSVGAKIVGLRFRPCEFTTMSDPSVEAGDVGYLIDRKTNDYQILVSNTKLKVGIRQSISCDAETPTKRQSGRTDPATKVIIEARKNTQQQLTTYDLMMQQITATVANGMGLFPIIEGDDYTGRITYMCDKATMAESVKRWFTTTGGFVQQTRPTVSDEWVTTSGVDVYGNAMYNTIVTKGIDCEWLNVGSIFGGFSLSSNGLHTQAVEEFPDYIQADEDRIQQIILGNIIPTESDFVRYDISRDGIIDGIDYIYMKRIILGYSPSIANYSVDIDSSDPTKPIIVSRDGGGVTGKSIVGGTFIKAIHGYFENMTVTNGATGNFTTVDSKTVHVVNGIITAIV